MKHMKTEMVQSQEVDSATCDKCGAKIGTGVEIIINHVFYEPDSTFMIGGAMRTVEPQEEKDYCFDCWRKINKYLDG